MANEVQPPPNPSSMTMPPLEKKRRSILNYILPAFMVVVAMVLAISWFFMSKLSGAAELSSDQVAAALNTPITDSGAGTEAASSGSTNNPLIGNWTLVDSNASCDSHEMFTATTNSSVKNGLTSSEAVIYNIHPNRLTVDVSTGGAAQQSQYDITGPDEIKFRVNSANVAAGCTYHRD